jgi:hypothetical protein
MLLSSQRSVDRGDKFLTRCKLQYVPQGADGKTFLHQCGVVVDGHKHDARLGIPPQDRGRGRDAVQAWHRNVGDNDIRGERCGGGNERVAIAHGRNDVELRLQHCAQAFRNRQMIICHEDTGTLLFLLANHVDFSC